MPPPRNAAANSARTEWGALLGKKISIRYRLHGDPANPFSEAIGVVAAIQQGERGTNISILTRAGETISVVSGDIVALKEFP